jgi:hypothetical protein
MCPKLIAGIKDCEITEIGIVAKAFKAVFFFESRGELLISPVAHEESMKKMGIITGRVTNVDDFAEPQRQFLEFLRANVFLISEISPMNYSIAGTDAAVSSGYEHSDT